MRNAFLQAPEIARRILVILSQRVIIDSDLAALYGVSTKRLNEQIKRNARMFPRDFLFRLTLIEREEVVANCDHLAKLRFSPTMPYALTEHGALMAASVLNTVRAIQVSVFVVRAFVRLRETMAASKDLAKKQFRQLIEALRQLMAPVQPKRRPIGFVTPKE